jgi:DNA-binding CsgD family transcriptional regulator
VLKFALLLTDDQHQITAIGAELLTVYFWGLCDDVAANALADRLHAAVTNPLGIGGLIGARASLQAFSGDAGVAMANLDLLPQLPDGPLFCKLAVIRSIVLTFVGRTELGREEAARAFRVHVGFTRPQSIPHPSTHTANEALALQEAGRFVEALERATVGYEHAISDDVFVTPVWCQLVAGECCVILGRVAEAQRHFQTALSDARKRRFRGSVALALAGVAMTSALLGDVDAALTLMAESDAETVSRLAAFAPNIAIGRAAVAVAHGNRGSAISYLSDAAADAAAGGVVGGEARVLHELARLGLAGRVADRLAVLAGISDSALVKTMSDRARASYGNDAAALSVVCESFAAMGALIFASEVASEAAHHFEQRGDHRRANASSLRSRALMLGCDVAPMTRPRDEAAITPLTGREREIAYLAAEGESTKAISARLFLSSRTVENHLNRVYTKLGVTSRQELQAAFRNE